MMKNAEDIIHGEIIVALNARVIDNYVLPSPGHCIISWKLLRPDPTAEEVRATGFPDYPTHTLTCDRDHSFEIDTDWKTEMIQKMVAASAARCSE